MLPEAAGLSRNSSSFSEKQRGQPDPVTRPADKWRWAGNPGRSGPELPGNDLPPSTLKRGGGVCLCLLTKSSQGRGVAEDPRSQWTHQSGSGREGTEKEKTWVQVNPSLQRPLLVSGCPSQRPGKGQKVRGGSPDRSFSKDSVHTTT